MVNQGKNTSQFPVKTSLNDMGDRLIFLYAANTANIAQTATISVEDFFVNSEIDIVASSILVSNLQITSNIGDPAHSNSLTILEGTIFFTNSYGYIAASNNNVLRWPLNSF